MNSPSAEHSENLQDSYYLTISSSAFISPDVESPGSFHNTLYSQINLPKDLYECGLCEVYYTPVNTLFGYSSNDNEFVIKQGNYKITHVQIIKSSKGLDEDIRVFNETQRSKKIDIQILKNSDKSKPEITYEIKAKFSRNTLIRLSEYASTILGFKESEYPAGRIIAELPPDLEVYKNLSDGTLIDIEIFEQPALTDLHLGQLDELTVQDLVTQFNISLRRVRLPITFLEEHGSIHIECTEKEIELMFSKRLNRILGIKNEPISGSSIVLDNVDLFKGNKYFLVHCDVITPQYRGSHFKPIIRMFPQSGEGLGVVNKTFYPVQYLAMSKSELQTIKIVVTNESDEVIPFSLSEGFTCVLNIRLKSV